MPGPYPVYSRTFHKYISLYSHCSREKVRDQFVEDRKLATVQTYTCSLNRCLQQFTTSSSMIAHIQHHIKAGNTMRCPFEDCKKLHSESVSFPSHSSRTHTIERKTLSESRTANTYKQNHTDTLVERN